MELIKLDEYVGQCSECKKTNLHLGDVSQYLFFKGIKEFSSVCNDCLPNKIKNTVTEKSVFLILESTDELEELLLKIMA